MIIPQASVDISDVYAFISTKFNDPLQQMLTVVTHVAPYAEAGAGPVYARFADDALYNIHITDPVSGAPLMTYSYRFSDADPATAPGLKNPNTVLSYGKGVNESDIGPLLQSSDPRRNFSQYYTVIKTVEESGSTAVIGSGLLTAPPNLGPNVTPLYNDSNGKAISGAQTYSQLDQYSRDAIRELPSGEVVFAGSREDGFYGDYAGIFDLLDSRIFFPSPDFPNTIGQQGGGNDSFKGYNTLAFAIQIPLANLNGFIRSYIASYFAQQITSIGVGVYASAERQRLQVFSSSDDPLTAGPWVQIERMGNPLLNTLFIRLRDKDGFNRASPVDDPNYQAHLLNPELAMLVNQLHSPAIPAFTESGRSDLADLYIPDIIRVDTMTGPVPLPGQTGFNRLGYFGGDMTSGRPSGWPNGRRYGDDVVDIALTALASGPAYANTRLAGDNVNANDQIYHQVFPYAATPHSGTDHVHH